MAIELTDDAKGAVVTAKSGDVVLFEYNYAPTYDPKESRKPFMHPVRSLAGEVVTGHPPKDHSWHRGIQMTCAHLRTPDQEVGENFWGGPTYVKGKNYVQLPNNGVQRHEGWEKIESPVMAERLTWVTQKGESWINEWRKVTVMVGEGCWAMDWRMVLENVHTKELLFGSPTTSGREKAGYGGLFWRGPESYIEHQKKGPRAEAQGLAGGRIFAGNGLEGAGVMGERAPWLAYVGKQEDGGESTLVFVDRPGNPDYPNKWFVRSEPFAIASFSFSFDREVSLPVGGKMVLEHRIVVANGAWDREKVEGYLEKAGLHD